MIPRLYHRLPRLLAGRIERLGTTMHILKWYSEFKFKISRRRNLPVCRFFFRYYFSSGSHFESSILSYHLPILLIPLKAALACFRLAFLDGRRKVQFRLASVLLHPEHGGRDDVRS